MSAQPTVILITGHPAAGKTTLARYLAQTLRLPLICKDAIKETLCDTVGWSNDEDSRRLSIAAWTLLYQQVEELLRTGVSHLVESNFLPEYADARWQRLADTYRFHLIQLRCEADGDTLWQRYQDRILKGERHPGHIDGSADATLRTMLFAGPPGWIAVESERIVIDTLRQTTDDYRETSSRLQTRFLRA
ncbi:MAG: AAA family ATPase [Caldilineaceae bacterium]|nr:AAA family ATPase [Caldilineaceae bacterium]